jgi:hypothetical protein
MGCANTPISSDKKEGNVMNESYKGWDLSIDYMGQHVATSPDYDVDCDIDGFYVCSGCILTADSIAELKELIDEYISC